MALFLSAKQLTLTVRRAKIRGATRCTRPCSSTTFPMDGVSRENNGVALKVAVRQFCLETLR
jgi:hypothetical protein